MSEYPNNLLDFERTYVCSKCDMLQNRRYCRHDLESALRYGYDLGHQAGKDYQDKVWRIAHEVAGDDAIIQGTVAALNRDTKQKHPPQRETQNALLWSTDNPIAALLIVAFASLGALILMGVIK